jgi:NAD+ synthase (glutamine-hydrolysing)
VTHPFFNLYAQGFARVATATPKVALADPATNAAAVIGLAHQAHDAGAALVVFPELCLTGYSIDDLHHQDAVQRAVHAALDTVRTASQTLRPLLLVGAPLQRDGVLYNCAVAIKGGAILGAVPKCYLPNYREFYEKRYFASGLGLGGAIRAAGADIPFGADLLFAASDLDDLVVHAEICEDLWGPDQPSTRGALAGATVLANLSASPITIGKARERHELCKVQSSRLMAAYVYSAAGYGESTTDLSWDGQGAVNELGALLAEGARFMLGEQLTLADVDLDRIRLERSRTPTFADAARSAGAPVRRIGFRLDPPAGDLGLIRPLDRHPFVPDDTARRDQDCYEAYNIQVHGLIRRLEATGAQRLVIGVSGGLDSTQALLVAAKAFDLTGRPRSDILAFTMPGFATGKATKANAWALMKALGVTGDEIDIRPAARRMLADIGHPFARGEPVYDVTFENVQAGLRTDYLFRLANQRGGLVLGTGDLSELALGWCTYGVGDHMSHYGVNSGVAKTLIQHLIRWSIDQAMYDAATDKVLARILATEISPELVPAGPDGAIQSTQGLIGPYELHDFFLFHIARCGLRPSKVAFLAHRAWGEVHDLPTIRKWLRLFLNRFFATSQFKRSAVPNGPKVTSAGALSPRGDWRAPSDSGAAVWLAELDANTPG